MCDSRGACPPLKPGDTIGICAPSGTFEPAVFQQGIRCLEEMGFRVHIPDDLKRKNRYLAGEDHHRAAVVTSLFKKDEVRAIMCARGGFGAMRLLPLLDFDFIAAHAKPFIGFSDITALLTTFTIQSRLPVIHGPVVTSLAAAGDKTRRSLVRAITLSRHQLPDVSAPAGTTLVSGRVTGRLMGGNLATLCHLAGTSFQPRFQGDILFLEDINEPPYKIDRMLTQMKMAGMFQGVAGVATGYFTDCGDDNIVDEILKEHLGNVPLFTGVPAGHAHPNTALPMGEAVVMDAAERVLSWRID